MKIEKVHAVYFSPTGTTKTVITHLVKCITTLLPEVVTEVKDFTLPSGRKKVPDIRESELAIVGLPVYAGRLPNLLLNYLTTWQSRGLGGTCCGLWESVLWELRSSNCMIF